MTETLEKEQEQTQETEKEQAKVKNFNDEIFKKLNEELLTEEVAKMIAETVTQTYDADDPLSRFFNDYINTKAETEEQEKNLRLGIAVGIVSYMAYREIIDFIDKRELANHIVRHLKVEGTMIKAVRGEQTAITLIPPSLVVDNKLDTDEKLIEFAKGLPPFENFKTFDGVEFKILTDEEMQKELNFLKEKMCGENEEVEEAEECQTAQ